jgi:PilZ domain
VVEKSGKERRLKPRYNANLACAVALAESESDILFPDARLDCRTRDLSETGVGLIAGAIYLGYTCVVDEGRALHFTLELPAGAVVMEATPAHYLRLDAGGAEPTYLIGLRITSMTDEDRALYNGFLEELSRSEQD